MRGGQNSQCGGAVRRRREWQDSQLLAGLSALGGARPMVVRLPPCRGSSQSPNPTTYHDTLYSGDGGYRELKSARPTVDALGRGDGAVLEHIWPIVQPPP